MKKFVLIWLSLFLTSGECVAQDWKELRGDHFIVFYNESESFGRKVLHKAEVCYNRIASDLGYVRYSNFWQWEKRVKIFIYPTKEAFLKATKQANWSEGSASYVRKEIKSYSGCRGFIDSVLPHEIAHLIFRDFVGFSAEGGVPLWLDEGVAQWQEPSKRQHVKYFVKKLYESGKLLSLSELTKTDVRLVEGGQAAQDFYVQAASLVDFLIGRYGTDGFTDFCRQLRDGRSMDEALRRAYSARMDGLADLENLWLAYIVDIKLTSKTVKDDKGTTVFFKLENE